VIKRILVPTDGSEHARKAVQLAGDIAGKYGAQLVLLHVLLDGATSRELRDLVKVKRLPKSVVAAMDRAEEVELGAATIPDSVPVRMPLPDEVLDAVGKAILNDAEATARKHGARNIRRLVERGRAAQSILSCAERQKANLIVMGSRGLGDLKGMLVGSVSHRVSNLSSCTCVTVK
jgi:nucleotide-binding universal stress UspA family protein